MAIHLSLIIQTTQLASGNILLETNYNDSLTQFKVSLSAADTLQWTHFSVSQWQSHPNSPSSKAEANHSCLCNWSSVQTPPCFPKRLAVCFTHKLCLARTTLSYFLSNKFSFLFYILANRPIFWQRANQFYS